MYNITIITDSARLSRHTRTHTHTHTLSTHDPTELSLHFLHLMQEEVRRANYVEHVRFPSRGKYVY